MRRGYSALWLSAALTSCVVGSFNVVDELPGAAGSSSMAGSSEGGSSDKAGSSSAGTDAPTAGKAPGGSSQGGTANQAGEGNAGQAGEPAEGQGGAGGMPAATPVLPCDQEANGMAPLLCDDFQGGVIDATKWDPPPGISPENTNGPHGATLAAPLSGVELSSKLGPLGIDTAGSEVTLSFWFKIITQQGIDTQLVSFQSRINVPISLRVVEKNIVWESANGLQAPSKPASGTVTVMQWFCVSLYLTSQHMDISYVNATSPGNVHTSIVDDMPTTSEDDLWQNQPEDGRKILGHPIFGGVIDGIAADIVIDDVRVARGKSNVCGI